MLTLLIPVVLETAILFKASMLDVGARDFVILYFMLQGVYGFAYYRGMKKGQADVQGR